MSNILAAIFLILLNSFFVVAEYSLVKVRKTRLEELVQQGKSRAKLAMEISSQFDRYVSTVQFGISLASLALGWLGVPAAAMLLEPLLDAYFPGSPQLHVAISMAAGFLILLFFHVVPGTLVPKSLAVQQAENAALFCAYPLYLFHKICYPLIALLNKTSAGTLRLLGVKAVNNTEITHSEEELRMIVSASHRGGVLNQMESELIDNVFDFAERMAREVMIPRQDMVCLFTDDSFEDNIQVVRETGHTRYPLCDGDKDHVLGMIHIRDLMDLELACQQSKDLKTVMREILMVPEGMSVAQLLQVMRRKRTHLAVVVDEYGGTAGLVGLEDVIEEIVGDIQDEHDGDEELEIQRFEDGSYEFEGRVLLDEVSDLLNIRLEEHDEDTIGGYIFGLLGRRPETGDKVSIGDYAFSVIKVNGFRIMRVKAVPLESRETESEE